MKVKLNYDLGWVKASVSCNVRDDVEAYEVRELWENVFEKLKNIDYSKLEKISELKNSFLEKLKEYDVVEVNILFDVDVRGGIEFSYTR